MNSISEPTASFCFLLCLFGCMGSSLVVARGAALQLQREGLSLWCPHFVVIAEHRLSGAWNSAVVAHGLSSCGAQL